jgi:hypothetical protein
MLDRLCDHVLQRLCQQNKVPELYGHLHSDVLVDIWCILMIHYEYYNDRMGNHHTLFVEYH